MIEKVNPSHPDKVADRIAGALVDLAYKKNQNAKAAVEVLIGHGQCVIIAETSEEFKTEEMAAIVQRIAGEGYKMQFIVTKQDEHLAKNQEGEIRCGDNGIFKGSPLNIEQKVISKIARELYLKYPTDGKFILNKDRLIVCQSNAKAEDIRRIYPEAIRRIYPEAIINPLGDWTGGPGVDAGATNRKLGSDMADGVTGGGLHGKDLSKADVSVNIWCFLEAQRTKREITACCAIGDTTVNGVPYAEIVETARDFINKLGGFEKFAEWGLF